MNIRDGVREKLGDKITQWREISRRRIYLEVDKKDILEAARILFLELGMRFATASGIDTPEGIEILYHFSFDENGEIYTLRVLLDDKKRPEADSITPLIKGAEWIEREMWEMLGIQFRGHPNLKRLLLADDWPEGEHPLRGKE